MNKQQPQTARPSAPRQSGRPFGRTLMKIALTLALVLAVIIVPGYSDRETSADSRLKVVTTTGIIADLVKNVGGNHVDVRSLVPEGGDPHTYEPTMHDVRDIVYARLAFSNYMMLEEQSLIRTLDANLSKNATHIALAEEASGYGAEIIPLVENHSLETVWLGMRVRGAENLPGATRASQMRISLVDAKGPGAAIAYVTGTFGNPILVLNSGDGINKNQGYKGDSTTLPLDAHTHMSWAFTKAGTYELHLRADYLVDQTARPQKVAEQKITVVVGDNPAETALGKGKTIISSGHVDITADPSQQAIYFYADAEAGKDGEAGETTGKTVHKTGTQQQPSADKKSQPAAHEHAHKHQHGDGSGIDKPLQTEIPADQAIIYVPPKALMPIPASAAFRFMGRPGTDVYQLPQAVLGKHVHGEIDPHLWQDVRNGQAYVEVIRDQLIKADPQHATDYRANAEKYLLQLDKTNEYVKAKIAAIPPERRHLITTHDAYGYLGHAYGLDIAGFVAPSPSAEPSLADRRRLATTLKNLSVPAVFLEPNAPQASKVLLDAAKTAHVQVCPLYGDAFTREINTYDSMMRANADSLHKCLGGK